MPLERYRLYHREKAKGGIALTMTAGSAVVSADGPQGFGNLHACRDEIAPHWKALADDVHEHGAPRGSRSAATVLPSRATSSACHGRRRTRVN